MGFSPESAFVGQFSRLKKDYTPGAKCASRNIFGTSAPCKFAACLFEFWDGYYGHKKL